MNEQIYLHETKKENIMGFLGYLIIGCIFINFFGLYLLGKQVAKDNEGKENIFNRFIYWLLD